MSEDLYSKLYEDRTFPDVIFVLEGNEIKAHKCVLADRCDYFRQYFNQNNSNIIKINGIPMKVFEELVKFCYLQQIDLLYWSYDDKECLYKLATAYKYSPLMDIVQNELENHAEVSPSVDTLNEWSENNRGEELRGWIRNNILNIVKFEACHNYTKDLIEFILDIFHEMCDNESNKNELRTEQKLLLKWLLRWRNWSNREEEDVNCIFSKLSLNFMSSDLPACEAPIRMKLSEGVCHFVWFREFNTAGWKRDEILELLCFAHVYDFDQLFDAVLNVVTTQHLEPSSFATIYGVARKLESSKLEEALVDYLRNNTNSILTSAQFTNYPANVVVFLFRNLSCQLMDLETKDLIFCSMREWRNSKNEKEVAKVFKTIKWLDFLQMLRLDLNAKCYKDDHSKDVTFVFDEQEIKAHKTVLGYSCNYFKQLFDQSKDNRIKMDGTSIKPFHQVIEYCYMQKVDFSHWTFNDKIYLLDLAKMYNYQSLIDFIKPELGKYPTVPLTVASLNQWYENISKYAIHMWVKNNFLKVFNYEDSHEYYKDLVVVIVDTVCELFGKESDKDKLEVPSKKLLRWLFRWSNWCNRKEDDVRSLFATIRLPFVFKDRALGNKTLQEKLFVAVRRFCHAREVDTTGWTCEDVLDFLYFAHDYEFVPLVDALVNVVATKYLEPTALEKIHDLASRLQCNKLQQIIADYINNQTMIILTSAEFTNYSGSLVGLILENLSSQLMDVKVKNQMQSSLSKWKASKSAEDFKAVFNKIQWEDFSPDKGAAVLRIFAPVTFQAYVSGLTAPAGGKGAQREICDNSQYRRSVRPRKE